MNPQDLDSLQLNQACIDVRNKTKQAVEYDCEIKIKALQLSHDQSMKALRSEIHHHHKTDLTKIKASMVDYLDLKGQNHDLRAEVALLHIRIESRNESLGELTKTKADDCNRKLAWVQKNLKLFGDHYMAQTTAFRDFLRDQANDEAVARSKISDKLEKISDVSYFK